METNPLHSDASNGRGIGNGVVSRRKIRERATEIGLGNGHPLSEVTKTEWEQAKRELADESVASRNPALLRSAPEAAHDRTKAKRTG